MLLGTGTLMLLLRCGRFSTKQRGSGRHTKQYHSELIDDLRHISRKF
jgi:hypothetical protein